MDIIVPQVGESIVEAEIGEWFKKDGDYVAKDELLMELETEKVNVELNAEAAGVLKITAQQGETVKIGAVIGTIDESAEETPPPAATTADKPESSEDSAPPEEETAATPGDSVDIIVPQVGESIVEAEIGEWFKKDGAYVNKDELIMELETEKVNVELNAEASGVLRITAQQGETVKIGAVIGTIESGSGTAATATAPEAKSTRSANEAPKNPAVPKIAAERGVDVDTLSGSGRNGRILVDDIPAGAPQKTVSTEEKTPAPEPAGEPTPQKKPASDSGERTTRVPMTQIRKKLPPT